MRVYLTPIKNLEFILEFTANTYSNYSTMEIALPIQFTKSTNKEQQMGKDLVTVNNLFGHWLTDIDIRCYPNDMRILPTSNSVDIYQYSNAQLKNLPEKSVKTSLKTFLYSSKPVYLAENVDTRPNNDNIDANRTDPNLTYRLQELPDWVF